MRLYVGKTRAEELFETVDGDLLDSVDMLTPAVVATTRIALGVLVGKHRSLRQKHIAADDIFRCDQFDLGLLTVKLKADGISNGGVGDAGGFSGIEHGMGPFRHKEGVAPFVRARQLYG